MTDTMKSAARTRIDAPVGGQAIVLDEDFLHYSRAVWITAAGAVNIMFTDGSTLVYNAVPVGRFVINAKRIVGANTTATVENAEW